MNFEKQNLQSTIFPPKVQTKFQAFFKVFQVAWEPWSNAPISVNRQGGNHGDSDSFLTSHPMGYDNGVQTQGQFWHLK